MAIPKKGLRPIVVDGRRYRWVAKGNDNYIHLTVCAEAGTGQKLFASFAYHHTLIRAAHGYSSVPRSQFVITPAVVREAISFGLAQGWQPLKRGADLALHLPDEAFATIQNFLAAKPCTFFEQPVFV